MWNCRPALSAKLKNEEVCDVGSIAVPLASGVDEQYLRQQLAVIVRSMRELLAVLMIMRVHGSPSKLAIIAAIVQRRSAR